MCPEGDIRTMQPRVRRWPAVFDLRHCCGRLIQGDQDGVEWSWQRRQPRSQSSTSCLSPIRAQISRATHSAAPRNCRKAVPIEDDPNREIAVGMELRTKGCGDHQRGRGAAEQADPGRNDFVYTPQSEVPSRRECSRSPCLVSAPLSPAIPSLGRQGSELPLFRIPATDLSRQIVDVGDLRRESPLPPLLRISQ